MRKTTDFKVKKYILRKTTKTEARKRTKTKGLKKPLGLLVGIQVSESYCLETADFI